MNTPDIEVEIEQIVEKVRTVEFLHGVPVELPNRTKELLRSGIREALTSRDTYWKESVVTVGNIQCENGYALAIKHFEERMQAGQNAREAIDGMKKIHRQKKATTPTTDKK